MTTLNDRLANIQKTLEALVSVEKHVEMTPEKFLGYALDQITKAGSEPAEKSTPRLKSLLRAVTIAKDNYTNDASGSIKVPIFVDDQTALKDQSNKIMTPDQAGGSPPNAQNYVTKMDELRKALASLTKDAADGDEEEAPESEDEEKKKAKAAAAKAAEDTGEDDDAEKKTKAEGDGEEEAPESEDEEKKKTKKVAKAGHDKDGTFWPDDMNDVKKGVAPDTEWGKDPSSK